MKDTSSVRKTILRSALLGLATVSMSASMADVVTGFEAGEGYAVGVLTGQNSWYNPVAGSLDWEVTTYAGNPYGIGPNPQGGGLQFITGASDISGATFGRCQIDNAFADATTYTATYDFWAKYIGAATPVNNIGSFSLQPSATNQFLISLWFWPDDPITGTLVANAIQIYDSAPEPPDPPGVYAYYWPTTLSGMMVQGKWYRSTTIWKNDGTSSVPLKYQIQDLTTGETFGVQASATWTMQNPTGPLATGIRFFAGGTENRCAVDNVDIVTYNNKTYAEQFAIVGGFAGGNNTTFALKATSGAGFAVQCDELDPNAAVEMLTSSPYDSPSAITFGVTSKASRTDMLERVRVWDWTAGGGAGAYAPAPIISRAATTTFSSASGSYTGTLSNYIRPQDGYMIIEISHTPSAEQDGFDGWGSEFRGCSWTFTP